MTGAAPPGGGDSVVAVETSPYETFEIANGGLVRPRRLYLAGAAVAATLAAFVMAGAISAWSFVPLFALIHCSVLGLIALRYAFYSPGGASVLPGALHIDANGQLLFRPQEGGAARVIARRDELTRALVTPTNGVMLVQLVRKGPRPPIYVRVEDEEEAQALLRALGQDAGHMAVELRIASWVLGLGIAHHLAVIVGTLAVFTMAWGIAGPDFIHVFLRLLPLWGLCVLVLTLWPMKVRVGTDGVLTRWLGRSRFYPHAETRAATVYDESIAMKRQHGVLVVRQNGERVRLPTGQSEIGAIAARQLCQRINEAAGLARSGVPGTTAVQRGERALVDWITDLRRQGAGATGHRTAATPPDVLLRLVEDSAAPAESRAGAAVVAITAGGDEARERVRLAAERSASPRLRVALTRIADEAEDEAIIEAIEAIERDARNHA